MSKKESPLMQLGQYLPQGCLEEVIYYLTRYKVHLTITRERKSILGNYRNKIGGKNHRITINGTLNKYAFLITLLHELGHLIAYEKFGNNIQSHGPEWKREYGKILLEFITKKIFPADIEHVLLSGLQNPAASSCADAHLMRVLRKYDINNKQNLMLVEELPEGSLFKIPGGKIYIKGKKVRKRFKCVEVATGKLYLFSPVYEIALAN